MGGGGGVRVSFSGEGNGCQGLLFRWGKGVSGSPFQVGAAPVSGSSFQVGAWGVRVSFSGGVGGLRGFRVVSSVLG